MRQTIPLALLFFFISCCSTAQEQVVPESTDTIPPAKITLLFVGDLMQHQAQLDAARTDKGTYDYSPCFSLVKEQISGADIAIGNLEVPIGGKPYSGYPAFCAPDEYLYAIKEAGFNVLLTANNHCLDRGKKGLERTILMLDSLRIPTPELIEMKKNAVNDTHYSFTKMVFELPFLTIPMIPMELNHPFPT
jgi:poly-gamma-glutamate capsule biosynthesis protein CapA/YwtB (metallophosphatase superfamily)